jgi:hypothetical protein
MLHRLVTLRARRYLLDIVGPVTRLNQLGSVVPFELLQNNDQLVINRAVAEALRVTIGHELQDVVD